MGAGHENKGFNHDRKFFLGQLNNQNFLRQIMKCGYKGIEKSSGVTHL